jgi:hypothetical protein
MTDYAALAKQYGGTTAPAQVDYAALAKQFGGQSAPAVATPSPELSFADQIKQGAGNAIAGLGRGFGSIGATLIRPFESGAENDARRKSMDDALQTMGAEPDSMLYQGGKLAGEIAGTAGAGGAVANGLLRAAPVIAKVAPTAANAITRFAPVIESGGLTLGPSAPTNALSRIALRTGGGAVNGTVSAGMVNPDDAGTGALIGGALPGAVKVAVKAGELLNAGASGLAKHSLGLSTGTGGNAVSTAYNAGKEGTTTFLDNMRGNVPMTDVLDSAKQALGQMRQARSAEYKAGMAGVSADKTVINFAPIDNAVASLQAMGNYKGQVINKNASGVVDDISNLVNQWKGLNPAEYHTPEGLDALKQAISDIRDTTQFGTAGRKAADTAYNAVKNEITTQAPTYAKVMKDYSQASETLAEVERALSLGNKAAADTSMRKLQSLMRNNVNTNFGNRVGLANTLEQNGADILPAVAGQAMTSWTPRGMAGLAASGTGAAALMTNPLALAGLPATSPRLVGEAAYALGAANRGVGRAGTAAQSKLMQLLGQSGNSQLGMSQFAPVLATAPVIAASQR